VGEDVQEPDADAAPTHNRRDLLAKAAVAGATAWAVPTILSVRAAGAESAPDTTPQNCVGVVSEQCLGRFKFVSFLNSCSFPAVVGGTLVAPNATFNTAFLGSTQVPSTFTVFRADAQGQPIGAPIQEIQVFGCIDIVPPP
jgi:hypothetical protein